MFPLSSTVGMMGRDTRARRAALRCGQGLSVSNTEVLKELGNQVTSILIDKEGCQLGDLIRRR